MRRCATCGNIIDPDIAYWPNGRPRTYCPTCRRERQRRNRARRMQQTSYAAPSTHGGFNFEARGFGVEIEFIGPGSQQTVLSALRAAGLEVEYEGYTHRTTPHWKLVSDASLNYGGMELVSPVLHGQAGFEALRSALTALRSVGCRVDRSCGLHVHHDARDFTPVQIRRTVEVYDTRHVHFEAVLPRSRRGSHWARPWNVGRGSQSYDWSRLVTCTTMAALRHAAQAVDRYHTVNVAAFVRHGSLEFRAHQGTLNFTKVSSWVRLTMAVMEAGFSGRTVGTTFDSMLTDLQVTETVREHYRARVVALAA